MRMKGVLVEGEPQGSPFFLCVLRGELEEEKVTWVRAL